MCFRERTSTSLQFCLTFHPKELRTDLRRSFFSPLRGRICLSLRQRFSATLFGSVLSSVSAISTPVFVFLCTHDSCSKSFWDSPLVEGPGRQVHPKTATFCLVLGFTPSWQPSRAHQSQNDLGQLYSGPSGRFVWHFLTPFRRLQFS